MLSVNVQSWSWAEFDKKDDSEMQLKAPKKAKK